MDNGGPHRHAKRRNSLHNPQNHSRTTMFPAVVLARLPLVTLLLSSLVVNNKSSNSKKNSNSNNQPATNNNRNNKKHVCVDITAHGLGHVAQTTAVLNQLDPNQVRLTIRSTASRSVLEERLPNFAASSSSSFDLIPYAQDAGMIMKDALHVDIPKTMEWYRTFHEPRHYQERIRQAATDLEALEPDLLLCNVPYLSLEAAHQVWGGGGGGGSTKIPPVIAMCSLNWADVFYSYCAKEPGASQIYQDMLRAYSRADVFVQPTPSMPMTNLQCRTKQSVGPIAMQGRRRMAPTTTTRTANAATATTTTTSLLSTITYELTGQLFQYFVLIGVGGMTIDNIPMEQWPRLENTCWIVPDAMLFPVRSTPSPPNSPPPLPRPDFIAQSRLESSELFSYIDLIASVDCILTKTGYGTQTEAVVHGIPTLCIERHDWPEHAYLKQWHQENGIVAFCDWQDISNPQQGRRSSSSSFLADTISNLIAQKQKQSDGMMGGRVQPTGAQDAASIIRQRLGLLD
jgi:hypothetical protein